MRNTWENFPATCSFGHQRDLDLICLDGEQEAVWGFPLRTHLQPTGLAWSFKVTDLIAIITSGKLLPPVNMGGIFTKCMEMNTI